MQQQQRCRQIDEKDEPREARNATSKRHENGRPWPKELKLAVAKAIAEQGLAVAVVSRQLGVPITTASQWACAYRRGGARYRPFAFTEHGAIQAANVLNSKRAVAMGVHVVRAFVHLRELLASNKDLAHQLDELEKKYKHHDKAIAAMLSAIRQLMNPPVPRRRGIGFAADLDETQKGSAAGPGPSTDPRKSPN